VLPGYGFYIAYRSDHPRHRSPEGSALVSPREPGPAHASRGVRSVAEDRLAERVGEDLGKIEVGLRAHADEHPEKMRQRRETVEHPFGTIKARMGATHFLMKTLPKVAAEMALHVLAYNLTRVMNIMGTGPLVAAMRA
jgi:transposase